MVNAVHPSERQARQVPAVERAVLVLRALGRDDRGRRLSDLSRELGYAKSTLSVLLSTLERFELVERDPDSNLFRLGMGLLDLGGAVLRRLDLRELARPALRRLSTASGETAILHVRDGEGSMIADRTEPRGQLKVVAPIGHRLPPFAGSVAMAMLATLPAKDADTVVREGPLPSFTPTSITSADGYLEALRRVREEGYAYEHGEYIDGVDAVSAAIVGANGRAVATLTVAAVAARVDTERMLQLGPLVAGSAREMSQRLRGPMGVAA